MKTYNQFAAELSLGQRALADTLFESVYVRESLMCFSDKEGDSKYFKQVPISDEELLQITDVREL